MEGGRGGGGGAAVLLGSKIVFGAGENSLMELERFGHYSQGNGEH